jgi:hypothetical protein
MRGKESMTGVALFDSAHPILRFDNVLTNARAGNGRIARVEARSIRDSQS